MPGDFRHRHARVAQQVPGRIQAVPRDEPRRRLAADLREYLVEVRAIEAQVLRHVGRRDIAREILADEILGVFHILLGRGAGQGGGSGIGVDAALARQVRHELQEQPVAFDDALGAARLYGIDDFKQKIALAVEAVHVGDDG